MSRSAALVRLLCSGAVAASACSAGAVRSDEQADVSRTDTLARAKVFRAPFNAELLAEQSAHEAELDCRFLLTETSGTTPKFDCELPTGETVKIKYGSTPEISGEIAATRLLATLGFGADRVVLASRLRCYGCPASPFYARRIAAWSHLDAVLRRTRDYSEYRQFENVAVEYKLEGVAVEGEGRKGWGFFELKQIDSTKGGARSAEVDALRMMAVFLAHWDNKAANQRLVCLPPNGRGDRCRRPLAMLQDVGATFGPRKVDLEAWRGTPIWADRDRCDVSMKGLPHGGGTFEDVQISESGRRLLADRLGRLSTAQIGRLFVEARFPGDIEQWTATFQQKVSDIATGPPCPN